jgi:hypothetical protein
MAIRTRYYSEDDIEAGITPSGLKRAGRDRQIEYMRYWFRRHFEDPAQETPYSSEEGGYLYIWGGPYDAKEQLFDEFGKIVSEDRINELAAELESDGLYDWAPGPHHPDRVQIEEEGQAEHGSDDDPFPPPVDLTTIIGQLEAGLRPSFGDAYELERRREVLGRLDELRRALIPATPTHGGIGHNRPPPDEDSPQAGFIHEIREAREVIGQELAKAKPEALQVAKATSRLQKALGWLGKKLDVAAESFAKGVGDATAKIVVVAAGGALVYPPLGNLIAEVVKQVSRWLAYVTLPF